VSCTSHDAFFLSHAFVAILMIKTLCATPVLMCEIAETAIKNVGVEALAKNVGVEALAGWVGVESLAG